jgi:hypothetical protein
MFLANYKFYLLDTVFLSHLWGFTKRKVPYWRLMQSYHNSRIFFTFHARELSVRYDKDVQAIIKKYPQTKFPTQLEIHVNADKKRTNEKKNVTKLIPSKYHLKKRWGTYGF